MHILHDNTINFTVLLHLYYFDVDEGTLPTLPPAIPVELSDDLAEESLSQPTSSSNTIVSVSQPSNSGNEVVCSTIVRQETDVSVATTGRN